MPAATGGDPRWTTLPAIVVSGPTVANGVVYVGDTTGHFHRIDAMSGAALWTSKPILANQTTNLDEIVVRDSALYAANLRQKRLRREAHAAIPAAVPLVAVPVSLQAATDPDRRPAPTTSAASDQHHALTRRRWSRSPKFHSCTGTRTTTRGLLDRESLPLERMTRVVRSDRSRRLARALAARRAVVHRGLYCLVNLFGCEQHDRLQRCVSVGIDCEANGGGGPLIG